MEFWGKCRTTLFRVDLPDLRLQSRARPSKMKPIHAVYTHEVYANLRPLHATWEPTQSVSMGDVGFLDKRAFRRETHLGALGISFSQRGGTAKPNIWFGSHGSTDIEFKSEIAATPGIAAQRAGLELRFNSEGSVFFHAAKCESLGVDDKVFLKKQILDCFHRGAWDPDWVVITETITAAATTIAVASQSGAALKLEARAASPTADLTEVGITFGLKSFKHLDFHLVSEAGLTPLIGLSKVSRPWFQKPTFEPALAAEDDAISEFDFLEID
jgi:hypothetical protein